MTLEDARKVKKVLGLSSLRQILDNQTKIVLNSETVEYSISSFLESFGKDLDRT